jgi:DNA-binding IclR family transcriptional regulator
MDPRPPSVPAKLLALLDAFSHEEAAFSLSELARRAGLPLTTAHRLIGELARWGGLERGQDGRYRIGLRLVELAALCPRGPALRDVALPFMEDLYEATHQNVQLAVRDGTDGVYIERIAGRHAVPVLTRVGAHWPLHATGVGLVLLAHAPADVQEQVLAGPLAAFTRFTITSPAQLRRTLAEVRRTGFALSDRQITGDAFSVAAPVMGPGGAGAAGAGRAGAGAAGPATAGAGQECVAALSIVVPVSDPHRASWAPAVRAAANGISRQLRGLSGMAALSGMASLSGFRAQGPAGVSSTGTRRSS